MRIGIIASKTGNGHISIMKAIEETLTQKYEVIVYPDFYEKCSYSNKILSDFYNYLMINSTKLCRSYSQMTYLNKADKSEDLYEAIRPYVISWLIKQNLDVIISTSHTINSAVVRIIKELKSNIKYYIVITDPFVPISVGFGVDGADGYFCFSDQVKKLLKKNKIAKDKIYVVDFPLQKKFYRILNESDKTTIKKKYLIGTERIILVNAGSQGINYYEKIIREILPLNDVKIICICGNNDALYNRLIQYKEIQNIDQLIILGYIENMDELLQISELVITKPGANTFFECIYYNCIILLDCIYGLLFQEQGIMDYALEKKVAYALTDYGEIKELIEKLFLDDIRNQLVENQKCIKAEIKKSINIVIEELLEKES